MNVDEQAVPSDRATRRGGRRRTLIAVGAFTTIVVGGGLLATVGTAAAATPAQAACTDGPWSVAGASVEGAPAGFDPGDAGRTYVWHDATGWHLRTTDARPGAHHYSGTIAASPDAQFVDVAKVKFDKGDSLWVDGHHVLHYAFTTYRGVDGLNFRVTACQADHSQEHLVFALHKDGTTDQPADIDLGAHRDHPSADPFVATR